MASKTPRATPDTEAAEPHSPAPRFDSETIETANRLANAGLNNTQAAKLLAHTHAPAGAMPGTFYGLPGVASAGGFFRKVRNDWSRLPRERQFSAARGAVEYNWFAGPVHKLRVFFDAAGFRFAQDNARDFAREQAEFADYDFAAVARDAFVEYLTCDHAVAVWERNRGDNRLPLISVVNCEEVRYKCEFGLETLRIYLPKSVLKNQRLAGVLDEKIRAAIESGRMVELSSDNEDSPFDFAFLGRGKRGAGFSAPSLLQIMDDLEHVQLTQIGDFNAALLRADIVRHTKKGHEIKTGPLAGNPKYYAQKKQIDSILEQWKKLQGTGELATNWDVDVDYVYLKPDVFSDAVSAEARRRLIFWGGWPAMLLLDGSRQERSGGGHIGMRLRADTWADRDDVGKFLTGIWNRPSFLGPWAGKAPRLAPSWNNSVLYENVELYNLINVLLTNGVASPQTVREFFMGLDNDEEVERMKAAHADREGYAPAFESRQGLLPAMFQKELLPPPRPTSSAPGGKGGTENGGGRPTGS